MNSMYGPSFRKEDISVAVIGLGYVGLPIAVAMGRHFKTLGFDINETRIAELRTGRDRTKEVTAGELRDAQISFSSSQTDLKESNFFIIAVPTPVDEAKVPDLELLYRASKTVGPALKPGDIVVYESTVYPGATEEDCVPVLEKASGLKAGVDFKVGYSPERINPGDKEHTLAKVIKVVAAQDSVTLDKVAFVYSQVVTAGVYRAESIKVAEAAKVIENTQRDLNIALMNELAFIFDRMNIDTHAVLRAAGTKWNFLKFYPGLVGGHCIGVDPYYLTHKAEKIGYHPQVILAGRRINDSMGKFVAQKAVKALVKAGVPVNGCTVTMMGLTFKENCPDLRNSRVVDIIKELQDYGISVQVVDPEADPAEALHEYGVELVSFDKAKKAAAIIVAVAHEAFRHLSSEAFASMSVAEPIIVDVKGLFDKEKFGGATLIRI